MEVGLGQLEESAAAWPSENAAPAPADRGPPAGRGQALCWKEREVGPGPLNNPGLGSQTTLALPWLWGPGSFLSLGNLRSPSEPQFNSYLTGLLQGFLSLNPGVSCCHWVLRETNTKQEVKGCSERGSILGIQGVRLHGVGKRSSNIWNSRKANPHTFQGSLWSRQVHNRKLCPIPPLTSPSTWPSPHPWIYFFPVLTPFLAANLYLTCNVLLTLPILDLPNPELPVRDGPEGRDEDVC